MIAWAHVSGGSWLSLLRHERPTDRAGVLIHRVGIPQPRGARWDWASHVGLLADFTPPGRNAEAILFV